MVYKRVVLVSFLLLSFLVLFIYLFIAIIRI